MMDTLPTPHSICATVCGENGWGESSREQKVAALAMQIATKGEPLYVMTSHGWNAERIQRSARIKERELRKRVQAQTAAAIRANPEAYGFVGSMFGLMLLGWIISGIVSAIVRAIIKAEWGV